MLSGTNLSLDIACSATLLGFLVSCILGYHKLSAHHVPGAALNSFQTLALVRVSLATVTNKPMTAYGSNTIQIYFILIKSRMGVPD